MRAKKKKKKEKTRFGENADVRRREPKRPLWLVFFFLNKVPSDSSKKKSTK